MYEEIGNIDKVTMYKMIGSLLSYDYFSTKCFVELLIEERNDKEETEILGKIKELLLEQKNEDVLKMIEKYTANKLPSKKYRFYL